MDLILLRTTKNSDTYSIKYLPYMYIYNTP